MARPSAIRPPAVASPSEAETAAAADDRRGLYLVGIAVFFFSTSPIWTRWAAETLSAYEITAGRMLTVGVVVLALALVRRERLPTVRDWPRFALFGLVAAAHFGFYIASLDYTTIAHSLALTYTAPIFVALFSWLTLGEGLGRAQVGGRRDHGGGRRRAGRVRADL